MRYLYLVAPLALVACQVATEGAGAQVVPSTIAVGDIASPVGFGGILVLGWKLLQAMRDVAEKAVVTAATSEKAIERITVVLEKLTDRIERCSRQSTDRPPGA